MAHAFLFTAHILDGICSQQALGLPCNPIPCWCEEPSPFSLDPVGSLLKYASRGFDSSGRDREMTNILGRKSDQQSHGIAPVGPLQIASYPCSG